MPWASMNPYEFWLIAFPLGVLCAAALSALLERMGR